MTAPPPAPVYPGKGLGIIPLGASLHYVLGLLRDHSSVFTSISTIYDPAAPTTSPVLVLLDNNGLRLRFDGPDQRLRLIEVLDFAKCRPTYQSGELTRQPPSTTNPTSGNPTFKNIYHKLFGPTYAGEYLPSQSLYILNYPGVSFSLPVDPSKWREDVDFASQLASTSASSMAIFAGPSWSEVRDELFTRAVTAPRIPTNTPSAARASPANDEIDLVRILDNNTIELTRRYNPPFLITLNATSPQDLITDLGPPSAIYRKSDHRLNIHRAARASSGGDGDDSDPEDLPSEDDDECSDMSSSAGGECFYNYFNHGFDVFVSAHRSASHPVATKLIIHGNVPGSYEFQRYRRCRWVIDLQGTAPNNAANGSNGASTGKPTKLTRPLKIHSEEGFDEVKEKLKERFGEVGKPMPFSRGSDSPSSSCELLGGWEDGDAGMGKDGGGAGTTFGNTELYGFPGMVFEVLKNNAVTCLTVF